MLLKYLMMTDISDMNRDEFITSFKKFLIDNGCVELKIVDKMPLAEHETHKKYQHFNESSAKYIVSKMHSTLNGSECNGEIFDMNFAVQTYRSYRSELSCDITYEDVYVAINAQAHDYQQLYNEWFGDDFYQKIIRSAIVFWFKDEDYDRGFKLYNYFATELEDRE